MLGKHFTDQQLQEGSEYNRGILSDAGLAARSGIDIRGDGLFERDRLAPTDAMRGVNFDYARQSLGGFGTYMGGRMDNASAVRLAAQVTTLAKDQIGVDPSAMAGFMGAAWSSGASGTDGNSIQQLLRRIAAATEEGKANMVASADSLRAMSSLMHMEQAATGAVGPGSMNFMQQLWTSFQRTGDPTLRGDQGANIMQKLGGNQSPQFLGMLFQALGGPGGGFSEQGRRLMSQEFGSNWRGLFPDASEGDILMAMANDPSMKMHIAQMLTHAGKFNGLSAPVFNTIMGLGPVTRQTIAARSALLHGNLAGINTELNGPQTAAAADASMRESVEANVNLAKEIAKTGSSIDHLNDLLEVEIGLARGNLWAGRQIFGDAGAGGNTLPRAYTPEQVKTMANDMVGHD